MRRHPFKVSLLFLLSLFLIVLSFKNIIYSETDTSTIPLGSNPYRIAINPFTDIAVITLEKADSVSVVDLNTQKVILTIPVGKEPKGVAIDSELNLALVSNSHDNTVSVIDLNTFSIIKTIPVGKSPESIAVNPSNSIALVANHKDDTVSVIDLLNYTAIFTIPVGKEPKDIAIDPELNLALVVNEKEEAEGHKHGEHGEEKDDEDYSTVSVIDLNTYQVTGEVPVGKKPQAIDINPETHIAAVANEKDNSITVIDPYSDWKTTTIPVCKHPIDIAINQLDNRALVLCEEGEEGHDEGGILLLIDLATSTTVKEYSVNKKSEAVAVNPYTNIAGIVDYKTDSLTLIQLPNPVPEITSINPLTLYRGSAGENITIYGNGFIKTSRAYLDNQPLETVFIDNHNLKAFISKDLLIKTGTYKITVSNPSPDGGISNQVNLQINNPVPSIVMLDPSETMAGTLGLTLTVYETGFFDYTTVYINGIPRPFTLLSPTKLQIELTSGDLETGKYLEVTASNPPPGGGLSNKAIFTVLNPVPSLLSINPTSIIAGSPDFTLTLTGNNFVKTSAIIFNNQQYLTRYISSTRLETTIPSDAIKTPGSYTVTVTNPGPGGGISNTINFDVSEVKDLLSIKITSPPNNSTVTTHYVIVEGEFISTNPVATIKVWGLLAEITGNTFKSIPTTLAPGINKITVTAQDILGNQAVASVNVTLQETPPPTGTEVKGYIHGAVYNAITKQPLSDAEVMAKGLTYTVHTDGNGRYTYPVPDEGGYQLFIEKEGYVTARRDAYVIIGRETGVDPVYLIPFDTKTTTIKASEGGTHIDSTGMVEVIIPSGALPYDMPISATYIPNEEAFPIPIPYGDNYIAGVQFTPEYITFKEPVTVRIKNTLGFAPGTEIPFAFASHDIEDTNEDFYDPGMGELSADSQFIEYELPHFSCMVTTLPGPPDNPPDTNPDPDCSGDDCGCDEGNCYVRVSSGNLTIDYLLPSYKIFGTDNGLTLQYNSDTVYNYIPVSIRSKPRLGSATPLASIFNISAFSGSSGTGGGSGLSLKFRGTNVEQRYRVLFDGIGSRSSIKTGVYYPNISVSQEFNGVFYTTNTFGGAAIAPTNVLLPKPAVSKTRTSKRIPIENNIDSPFGAGWMLSGYERLYINPDGNILLTDSINKEIFKPRHIPQPLTTRLRKPSGIAVDASDIVYVADSTDGSIFTINSAGDVNLLTKVTSCNNIRGITIGPDNNLYIATGYHKQIEKVVPSTGETSFYTPKLNIATLEDIVFDSKGNLYAVDGGRGEVLKIAPGGIVSTFAAGFINPISIIVDKDDNLYVTNNNNTGRSARCGVSWISKIDPAGNVSTHVSDLNAPMGITIDSAGNLYVVDTSCTDIRLPHYIYRIMPNGLKELLFDKNIGSGYAFGLAFDLAFNSKGELLVSSTTAGAIISIKPDTLTYQSPEGDYSVLTKEATGTFTRRLKDGTTIRYNAQGLITSKTDKNGNTYTYTHDGEGKLISITDPIGQTTTLNYSGGLLSSITDPSGRTTTFNHDGNRNLVSITGPDGATTTYGYDDRRLLTFKRLPGGETYQYTFDQYGKIRTAQAPTGETRQYSPEAVQKLINDLPLGTGTPENPAEPIPASDIRSSVTDGKGYTRYIKTDKRGVIEREDPLGRKTSYIRDINGNPTQITLPDGNIIRMSYDNNGNLLSRSDQLNNTTRFTYESIYNQIATIREPNNQWGNPSTSFAYDINGNLTTITDALNNATGITYNNKGLIASITDAQGNVAQYTYNALYQLSAITDALGNITTMSYDSKGNLIELRTPNSELTTFTYDILDRLVKVTDPSGGITTYTYDSGSRCDCGEGNPGGNITSLTDANGNRTTFEYNQIGQLTKTTDPLGNIKTYSYDMNRNLISITDAKGNTITYDYDPANRLIKKAMPEGVTDYAYNLVDNLTSAANPDITYNLGYDAAGRNTSFSMPLAPRPMTLSYTYDKNSNRTGTTGAASRYYSYDQINRLTATSGASYTYDSLSRRTRMSIYGAYETGININYTYDKLSRLTKILDQKIYYGAYYDIYADLNYTYDELSRRTGIITPPTILSPASIVAPYSLTTNIPNVEIAGTIDDPSGNIVEINNNPVNINPDGTFATFFSLNSGDNIINIKLIDVEGREISKDIKINHTIPVTIDAPGLITVRVPQIRIAGTIDDPQGYTVKINGKVVAVTPEGTFETIINLNWGYNYIYIEVTNPSGQITKQIIATYGPVDVLNYIAVNPISREVYALQWSDTNKIIKISPDGTVETVFTFPTDYYPATIAFSPGGELYISTGISYWIGFGVGDSILRLNPDGTTTTITTGISAFYMAIDSNNNIYAVDNTNTLYRIAPDGTITTITTFSNIIIGGIAIDSGGNIYVSAYTGGVETGYIYKITPDGTQTTLLERLEASEIGSIISDSDGNIYAIERVWTCGAYRILKISGTASVSIIAEECDDFYSTRVSGGIGIDTDGGIIVLGGDGFRILKVTQAGVIEDYLQPPEGEEVVTVRINVLDMSLSIKVPVNITATKYIYGTKTYSYDNLSRLTGVMKEVLEEDRFSYDPVGNRLSDIANNTYAYNSSNELLNYDGITFTYDLNGNMTLKTDATGTTRYTYNTENQLIRVDLPDGRFVEYRYDPFGRRIQKAITDTTNTTTVTKYVYDNEDILFELDGNGNIITEYLHGPGIDEPIAMIRGGKTYYYHADGLGSIIAITNSAGWVVQRYDYNSFGEITYIQDPNFIQPYTYTGREYDNESGLYYYRARYYDAKVGRFISEDPIGFEGGINFYVYVGNNPVNFTDPSGLVGPAVIGIGIGIRVCLSNPACSSAVLAGGAALGAALGNLLRDLPPPEKCDEEFWDCELIYKRPKDLPKHGVRALECTYSCKSNKGRQLIVTRVVFAENCPAKPSGF